MLGLLAIAAVAPAQPPEGPPFPRIANCYAIGLRPDAPEDDLAEIAQWDLLIGGVYTNWADADLVAKMRARMARLRELNPHTIILDFSSSAPYTHPNDAAFPEGGWLLQPDGSTIDGWPGTRMVNILDPEVQDYLVQRSLASVRDRGFDGTFIDCMGNGFDWWACNIEAGTAYAIDADEDGVGDDRDWLNRAWVAAKAEISRRVREAIGPDAVFMTNQAREWGFPHMNGILFEDDLDYVIDGRNDWDATVQLYLHWCQTPHRPNVTTIVSSSGIEPPYNAWQAMTEAEREAMLESGRTLYDRMRFGLATTLMGDGYYAYDLHTRWRGQRWWYPEYDAPLGYPKAPAEKHPDGTWWREFDGGTVVVNPTRLDARVKLGRSCEDVSTRRICPQHIVPALDGRIFVPTDARAREGDLRAPRPLLTLTGSAPAVERDGNILVRFEGGAAMLDSDGTVHQVWAGHEPVIEGIRPFIAVDDRWRDYAYTDVSHSLGPDGTVTFTGKRTEGDAELAFTQTVRPEGNSLSITYAWDALTPLHAHMWRHQVDLPVAAFAGGSFEAGGTRGTFPVERAEGPVLADPVDWLKATPQTGHTISIGLSAPGGLVDERHYGVSAYRLGLHPRTGDIEQGWTCEVDVRITVD